MHGTLRWLKTCSARAAPWRIAPETRSRADLKLFKLTAWTSELGAIPVARTLAVPEPLREDTRERLPARELPVTELSAPVSADEQEIKTVQYQVLIHLVAVEEPWLDGDAGAARQGEGPQDGHGGAGGDAGRRRRRLCPWKRGVPDLRSGPAGVGQPLRSGTGGATPVVEGGSWGLPPLVRPGPFTVKLAVHSFVASDRSQEFSVLLVGDRVEGADKQGAHATVGSSASAPSEGGGGVGHLATAEDALDIPQVGLEEGPERATDQGKGAVV
jgi:hypothetical protein